ncbi:unnamed protein product [Meganyctiphanes norvegica]|uniref:Uncharacterized protein n=1 Tax=Meganyctiphanes norvegica TaxID=48144 RepID=A0AAV2SA15_MEGNR
MAAKECDIKAIFHEIVIVDNNEKFRALRLKLSQLSQEDFLKLVNEYVKLMFSTRDCDDIIINKDKLKFPEKFSDPYIRLGSMSFLSIFSESDYYYFDYFMRGNFIIKISQIVVDKYIPCVEGSLFNARILIDLIHMIRRNYSFSSTEASFAIQIAAETLSKNQIDLQDEFYENLINLLAQIILIEIKCTHFKNMSDVMLVSINIVKFFDIYCEISEYIVDNYPKSRSIILIDKPGMSSIAVITNCIFLFQAKLLASDIDSSHWSSMICRMEKLRDHIAIFSLPPSSGISLQRFLIERAHGNFKTNCTKKLYNLTNDINQIDISKKASDITVKTSLTKIRLALCYLMQHVNEICHKFNMQHRVIKKLYSANKHFISIAMHMKENMNVSSSSDEYLSPPGSEYSTSVYGETEYLYSDDEISSNGNEASDSGTDENV